MIRYYIAPMNATAGDFKDPIRQLFDNIEQFKCSLLNNENALDDFLKYVSHEVDVANKQLKQRNQLHIDQLFSPYHMTITIYRRDCLGWKMAPMMEIRIYNVGPDYDKLNIDEEGGLI